MSDDHSPGDARKPYSDQGGPAGRHAETHDVEREALTNPTGGEPVDESFAEDLAKKTPASIRREQVEATEPASADKDIVNRFPELNEAQLSRLSILEPGTQLEQGSIYLDLNDRERGPFKAIGGQEVDARNRIIAKRETDFELWNELVGRDDTPEVERPE